MSLIIATGSNIGLKEENLAEAKKKLAKYFNLVHASRVYSSAAVDYINQPDFYNQMLEFKLPDYSPQEVMKICLEVEIQMGRKRDIPKGPRRIDIDIIFWGTEQIKSEFVTIPHSSWKQRSFVVLPLQELPYFKSLKNHYNIPKSFTNTAVPL